MGVPMAKDKTFQPSQIMTFVGYELNTTLMEVRLPQDSYTLINNVLEKEKITLKDLQSIIGTQFCMCSISRAFLRRLIDLTIGISKPIYKIRITKSVKEDLIIWRDFLSNFNGKSSFLSDRWLPSESLNLFTDDSGTLGYRGCFWISFVFGEWNTQWRNITLLEVYPIVLAVEICVSQFKNSCVVFHTDNLALVTIINKQTSKHVQIMFFIRKLVLSCLRYNVQF